MQRWFVYVLGFSALLLGCEPETRRPGATDGRSDAAARMSDANVPTKGNGDAAAQRDATPVDTRETDAMPAAAQCAAACERQANELAHSLMTSASGSLAIEGGDCARVDIDGVVAGMACTCQTSNGWMYIGPEGAGCFARGRAGDCLWDDSEFDACTQGDPSCHAKCEELEKRYAADAAKTFDVEVRYSACQDEACHYVLRIEDACYADRSFESGRRFDCKLSDPEILEREAQRARQAAEAMARKR